MIPTILFVIFGGYIGSNYAWNRHYEPRGFLIFCGAAVGATLGVVTTGVLGQSYATPDDYEKYRSETEIISLQNNMTTQGDFFLGIGSVDGVKMYYYYVQTDKGAINRRLPARETYVKETGNAEPKVVRVWYERKFWSSLWYIAPDPYDVEGMENPYTQIVVPEGSIKRQYNPN